ncbi:CRAL/TRIO N-terminal domain superfamily [Arabidopsis thaliana x Arabidopsis arenosa]|uniref:CRAL/TRIO N-terminal domain superfamily n=1 Tax=Arabidopsis thaliana x Arabidopsis arenosa TaxID=1240361 RepID=A0A8T1Z2H5_9BRAS|nr:CRAL/TRIO N-terminal domain superfamily [Arabidopsis thaliana x Arabidopsis arenosa]
MLQDSATTTTPPPPSTSDVSMLSGDEQEPKHVTLEEEAPVTSEPNLQLPLMPELEESNHAAEVDSEKSHQMTPETVTLESEGLNHAAEDSELTHELTPETETLKPEVLNHAAEDSEQTHEVTAETETSKPDVLNHAAEDSEKPHGVTPTPEKETSETDTSLLVISEPEEPNHEAEEDSEKPETEPSQKLMLEQRRKYMEVEDWTEPELPDAAVLEAAASVPEPQAQPPTTAPTVESRSLAEMMNREEAEAEEKQKIQIPRSLGSFKEETNKISDLSEQELNALHELRHLLQVSQDSSKSFIWGVPLLKDDRTDVVLLKFLRARDFKPQEAYSMLKKTLQWRIDFNIEELLDENLGDDLDKVVFMQGNDKDNHPVCYNVYGEFQNKDLYQKTFSDEEKRERFLRWRIQFLEKSIRNLDFVAGGVSTICQVNDLKNSPGPGKTELRLATKQALHLLQDNYPEFVSKQIFINVPWWYLAFYRIISPFMSQRSKSKLVFAGPSRSAETLFKYISPEHVPVQYGGLSVDNCDCNSDFTHDDIATEITIKPTTKQTVEIIVYEKCTIVWEIRVVGWEVSYGAEFVPENKEGYTVIIQKPRKMTAKNEPVVSQSFKVGEVGRILLTVDNPTSTKKILIYRFKVKPLLCE